MTLKARKRLVLSFAVVLLSVMGVAYAAQEWRYLLPTPRPHGLIQPRLGSAVAVDLQVPERSSGRRPKILHFYNPECPCSRFNETHLRSLAESFGEQVDFAIVVPSGFKGGVQALAKEMNCSVIEDKENRIAIRCGVYSTPQAVIFDRAGTLFFRGNYNRSRFCNDPNSEYTRIALDALVHGRALPPLSNRASVAYGCALPNFSASSR